MCMTNTIHGLTAPCAEQRARQRAFTLLELMIVLVIITVVLAVAWPSLRRPFNRAGTLEAARQLAADVAQARRTAITRGETIALRFELDGARYRIESAEPRTCESDTASDSLDDIMPADDQPESDVDQAADDEFATSSSADAGMPASEQPADSPLPPLEPIEQELPNGVLFADPDAPIDQDPAATGLMPSEDPAANEEDPLADPESSDLTTLEKLAQADKQSETENWSTAVLFFPTGRTESVRWRLKGPDDYWVTVTLRGMTGSVQIGRLEHPVRTGSKAAPGSPDSYEPVEWTDKPLNAAPVEPMGPTP